MAKGEKIATNLLGRHVTIKTCLPGSNEQILVVAEVVNVYLNDGRPEYTGNMLDFADNEKSVLFHMSERTKQIHGKLVTFWNDDVSAIGFPLR